jgi:hypothetical protein
MAEFRSLGATTVRDVMFWALVAPNSNSAKPPKNFNATNPNAYPAANWAPYDAAVRWANYYGLKIDFTVAGGAPQWAEGSGIPAQGRNPHYAWKPNAKDYGEFMQAVAKRYSGTFTPRGQSSPLPAVHFWALWNEPNFGEDLGPQAIDGSSVSIAPMYYRSLVAHGWSALKGNPAHKHDTILIGEFAARGLGPSGPSAHAPQGLPGNYAQTKPLEFVRTLYCLSSSYQPLRGSLAGAEGCPTTSAGTRRFRSQNPGLFSASGVGDHPYPDNLSPTQDGRSDPDFAAFPDLGNLEATLDRATGAYGAHPRYSIYSDEYGYITSPPASKHYVSPTTAADYLNWAEYLSWRSGRVASYAQYLLHDPSPTAGPYSGFSSGLFYYSGKPKQPVLNAYRLPLYLPRTSVSRTASTEVWGNVRPGYFTGPDSGKKQTVALQLQARGRGAWKTIDTVSTNGYFDIHVKLSSSGNLRLQYAYPRTDPLMPIGVAGSTIDSRTVAITVH